MQYHSRHFEIPDIKSNRNKNGLSTSYVKVAIRKAVLVTIAISTIYRHELLNFRKQLDESLVKRVILSVMSLYGFGTHFI